MTVAPKGVMLDTPERILLHAHEIALQAVLHPRDAARQRHRDHAGGAPGPRRVDRRRRQGGIVMTTHRAVRGRLLTFVGDPAEVGAAASHRYIHDGLVVIEGGLVSRRGRRECAAAHAAGGHAGRPLSGSSGPARADRHPHPLPADAGDRLLRRPAAGMAAEIHLRRGAEVQGPGACRAGGDILPRRAAAQRHHHRRGLLHGPAEIGRCVLRREPAAQHADDRRQGDDGPGAPEGCSIRPRPATATARRCSPAGTGTAASSTRSRRASR